MKKLLCLALAVMLCVSLACPALAAEADFVPSIGEKDAPGLIQAILKENGVTIEEIPEGCLVITSVAQAGSSGQIPEDAKSELLQVYEALKNGSMTLPYDKVNPNIVPEDMVIRDLFDLSWLCADHPEQLKKDGVTLVADFDLGVGSKMTVVAMAYVNGQWVAVPCVNNGDGSVTCEFEEICPVVFSVSDSVYDTPAQTGDTANVTLWIVLLAVSAVALVGMVFLRRKTA